MKLFKERGIAPTQALIIFAIIIVTALVLKIIYKDKKIADDSLIATLNRINQEQFRQVNEGLNKSDNFLPNSKMVILKDIAGGKNFGTAERSYLENKFSYQIIAFLPKPPTNYFYEGWLKRTTPFSLVSLGKMTQDKDGNYLLNYSFESNLLDHNLVLVTLEVNDNNSEPAQKILEGEFK